MFIPIGGRQIQLHWKRLRYPRYLRMNLHSPNRKLTDICVIRNSYGIRRRFDQQI